MWQRILFLLAFALVIELIVYFGLRRMLRRVKGSYVHDVFMTIHWLIPIVVFAFFIIQFFRIGDPGRDFEKFRAYFMVFGIFVLFFIPRLTFSISVIWQWIYYGIKRLVETKKGFIVKRPTRKSYLVQKIGLSLSFLLVVIVMYGMMYGKSNYQIRKVEIEIADLPKSFDGYQIMHFSDAHMGSFMDKEDGIKGIDIMTQQDVDIVLFTGDMVNNVADEMKDYIPYFRKISAKDGKYAVLGNHDMGDYVKWSEFETKEEHLQKLVDYQKQSGFTMLRNQSITLKRGRDSIAILGIDNWGEPPFKQYGDLKKAIKDVKQVPTKILLSHDPSHWRAEVIPTTDIDVMLAGHTHGMQFGFRIGNFRWSPSKWIYPEWWGLYQNQDQYLYVNPGFGFIGFPGRIGVSPEITIITLVKPKENVEQ